MLPTGPGSMSASSSQTYLIRIGGCSTQRFARSSCSGAGAPAPDEPEHDRGYDDYHDGNARDDLVASDVRREEIEIVRQIGG